MSDKSKSKLFDVRRAARRNNTIRLTPLSQQMKWYAEYRMPGIPYAVFFRNLNYERISGFEFLALQRDTRSVFHDALFSKPVDRREN